MWEIGGEGGCLYKCEILYISSELDNCSTNWMCFTVICPFRGCCTLFVLSDCRYFQKFNKAERLDLELYHYSCVHNIISHTPIHYGCHSSGGISSGSISSHCRRGCALSNSSSKSRLFFFLCSVYKQRNCIVWQLPRLWIWFLCSSILHHLGYFSPNGMGQTERELSVHYLSCLESNENECAVRWMYSYIHNLPPVSGCQKQFRGSKVIKKIPELMVSLRQRRIERQRDRNGRGKKKES